MKKIINAKKAPEIARNLKSQGKKIVLAGGCFDILHLGHVIFLQKAKAQGDVLFILLESDANVSKLKGSKRPIHNQLDRAKILESLIPVDYVVLLPEMKTDKDYDNLIYAINPDIIALTEGSQQKPHAQRQAKKLNSKVLIVTKRIKNKSTSNLAKIIIKNFNE
jgi:rfaE bifunctional protein nucleotidyltransferase chain/domain